MKITIISLRNKIITLEVSNLSAYRQISFIFQTDEEDTRAQTVNETDKSRLALSKTFRKKDLTIEFSFDSVPFE